MEKDKEKWSKSVLESMKGSQRAKPSAGLFEKIENRVFTEEAKVISIYQRRITTIAAVFLLSLNIFAVQQFNQSKSLNANNLVVEKTSSQSLISNYNIYE